MNDCIELNEMVQESLERGAQIHQKRILGLTNAAAEEIEVLSTIVGRDVLDLFLVDVVGQMGNEQVLDIQHFSNFYG